MYTPGYDNWKTQSPYDMEELTICQNCNKETSDPIWTGSMEVCPGCYDKINTLQSKANELLKPILALKKEQLKKKLKLDLDALPMIMCMNWLKKELKHYNIHKDMVKIENLNTEELEAAIEIIEGLNRKICGQITRVNK